MKREGHLYAKICSPANIAAAHRNARKDKKFYREVQDIDADPKPYFEEIRKQLVEKTFRTSEYTIFEKFDSGKIRTIYKLPYFPDRIVHWAIMLQVEHLFLRVFSACTHAATPGRGIHSALRQVKQYTDRDPAGTRYCLKIDIRKFFPNINHVILKHQFRRIIKCPDTLALLDEITDSIGGTTGVPVGNYLSQYFANLYLAWFDHWCKEVLHIRYYTRYMDDIVILAAEKETLWRWLNRIRNYLQDELWLRIKPNYAVFPVHSRSIDFVGYKNWGRADDGERSRVTLRKTTWKRMRRTMLDIRAKLDRGGCVNQHEYCQYNSYSGWNHWCVNRKIMNNYLLPLKPAMQEYYRTEIKKDDKRMEKH